MAEPASPPPGDSSSTSATLRELAEKALLAGLGLLSAAKEQAQDAVGSGDGPALKERASGAVSGLLDDLGFVTRERHEELELKVAQLEHRVRLLEGGETPLPAEPESPPASA
jgi:polyhydroxyalkanoate synthesis regulator phasin